MSDFYTYIPEQVRYIDPYEQVITTNAINKQFAALFGSKGIVRGLDVIQTSGTGISLKPGIAVIDKVVIELTTLTDITLPETNFSSNKENVLFMYYEYKLQQPAPEAIIDVREVNDFIANYYTGNEDKYLIIKFIKVNELGVIESTYDNSSETELKRDKDYVRAFIKQQIENNDLPIVVDHDINLHGHKVVNTVDPTDDLDIVTKKYADNFVNQCKDIIENTVLVDSESAGFNHYSGVSCKQGGFLDELITVGNNIHKEIITNPDGYKVLKLSKDNRKVKVIAGDSIYGGL